MIMSAVWKLVVLAPLSAGSEVQGRFRLEREGKQPNEFSVAIPPNATTQEIGQIALQRAKELVAAEPSAALLTLQQLSGSKTVWQYDPNAEAPPADEQPAA
jgi:hypothetical protein